MGSELLKMADGFALVAESLRELAGQAVEEAKAETKQELSLIHISEPTRP